MFSHIGGVGRTSADLTPRARSLGTHHNSPERWLQGEGSRPLGQAEIRPLRGGAGAACLPRKLETGHQLMRAFVYLEGEGPRR